MIPSAAMSAIHARAVRITEPGDPDVLRLDNHTVRSPGVGEILVRVVAAGLNRADVIQRRGFYPAPYGVPSDVPGLEYAGVVEALGPNVRDFAEGDRVMGIVGGGAMSTHLVTHEREALRIPEALSFTDAAAVPEVFLTAYDALFEQAELAAGEELLVHAVGSGVGTAALAMASLAGATVTGTARTQEKLDLCLALGLHRAVLAADGSFEKPYLEAVSRGANVILDVVGASYLEENVRCLATHGRLVILGQMGGGAGSLPIGALMSRRARVMGSTLRARPLEEKARLTQRFAARMLPLFARGALRPTVSAVLPMRDVAEAHRRMEHNETFGKIVLSWEA